MNDLNLLFKDYLEYCKYRKKLNEKTIKAYHIDFMQYLTYVNYNISDGLSRNTLDSYITELHKKYKPKSVKRKIASLKTFIRYLVYIEVLEDDPFNKIDVSFREPKLLPKTMPLHIMEQFFSALYAQKEIVKTDYQIKCLTRDIAVCELLFATGMRISELCSLSQENIDLENGTIRIYGKGSKERILQIGHNNVITALTEYKYLFLSEIDVCGFFFVNRLHSRLSDQSVRFMINKYVTLAAINLHITPHMFRHSLATLLLEQDVDIRYIQKILGHSSITTTEIYTHVSNVKQRDILINRHPRNFMKVYKG